MPYTLKAKRHYRPLFNGSDALFDACWRKWRRDLNDGLDDPCSDEDVIDALDQYASDEVNDSGSSFYIYG